MNKNNLRERQLDIHQFARHSSKRGHDFKNNSQSSTNNYHEDEKKGFIGTGIGLGVLLTFIFACIIKKYLENSRTRSVSDDNTYTSSYDPETSGELNFEIGNMGQQETNEIDDQLRTNNVDEQQSNNDEEQQTNRIDEPQSPINSVEQQTNEVLEKLTNPFNLNQEKILSSQNRVEENLIQKKVKLRRIQTSYWKI